MGLKISRKCQKLHMLVVFCHFLDPLQHQNFFRKISNKIACSISCKISHSISHKIFPQGFPKLDPDWLAPHHPIPNAKFPPITAFLKLVNGPRRYCSN